LPISDSKPPSNGITAQLQDYYTTLGREAAEAQKAESNPLTVDDEIFTQQTLHNAGTLLHLGLLFSFLKQGVPQKMTYANSNSII